MNKRISLLFLLMLLNAFTVVYGQQTKIDSLERVLETLDENDTSRVNTLYSLAFIYIRKESSLDTIYDYGEKIQELSERNEYKEGLVLHKYIHASYYSLIGDTDKELALLKDGIEIADKNNLLKWSKILRRQYLEFRV